LSLREEGGYGDIRLMPAASVDHCNRPQSSFTNALERELAGYHFFDTDTCGNDAYRIVPASM